MIGCQDFYGVSKETGGAAKTYVVLPAEAILPIVPRKTTTTTDTNDIKDTCQQVTLV